MSYREQEIRDLTRLTKLGVITLEQIVDPEIREEVAANLATNNKVTE